MPIIESQLNGRIATLLDRMNVRWRVIGESHGAFQGSHRQPDIIVTQQWGQPVILENEYIPARTVESDAQSRLGETLDTNVTGVDGTINAVVALKSPIELRDCNTLDEVDELLKNGVKLEYALLSKAELGKHTRFPKQGFIAGSIKDLAVFVWNATTHEETVREAIRVLEHGINDGAAILKQAAEFYDSTKQVITEQLMQDYSEQTLRMAATIMLNAFVFHQSLAGYKGIGDFNAVKPDGVPVRGYVLDEWRKILKINYWSIFSIAFELLRCVNPPYYAVQAMKSMMNTAERLHSLGVVQSHDLTGTVFQRLIADRKFLATFYTRPESATLLAHLAIPDDGTWDDPERMKNFQIADYACGTGTLIHAAYRRVNQLHLLSGGNPEELHAHMMKNSLTACDVLPSAVHLTASMLSSSHPQQRYDGTRTIVTQYGKTDDNGISIGSLDLLGSNGEVKPLIPLHSGTAVTGTGEGQAQEGVEMPPYSQDLVIMNPPFTRPGSDWEGDARESDYVKHFRGLSTDLTTQRKMSGLKKKYTRGTCDDGRAGLATTFMALADRMVKQDGIIALVLPMTALQGSSWQKVRQLIAERYTDVIIITIAAARPQDQSFSADTGMAETLIICRQSSETDDNQGLFVSLDHRPRNEMESIELARAISLIAKHPRIRSMEDGPFGGNLLLVGEERLGEVITASLSKQAPWSAAGVRDFSVVQAAHQMSQGNLWMPQMNRTEMVKVPIATVQGIAEVGIYDMNIVGTGALTAFDLAKSPTQVPTYPMLWGHNAEHETHLVVPPDSEGRVKHGREDRASEIWKTSSHAHHNRDFGYASQPLAVAFTERQSIGGRSWPNIKFDDYRQEMAYSLWGNSTLGLLCYWWHSSRQQSGRGIMPITAIRTMPTLDITKLSEEQLSVAETIFEDMKARTFLPANEAWHDDTRKELDRRVLIEMLGLPERIMRHLDLLRRKWCSEPSVHGGKSTAPPRDQPNP